MDYIKNKLLTSGIGLMSIESVHLLVPSPDFIGEVGKLVIQLAIGVVTLIKLLKDNRPKK